MGRRLDCPVSGHTDAYVILPEEWLGKHAMRRDEALRASAEYKNLELTNCAIAMALCEGWENIPGIEGNDPTQWDLAETPLSIIAWLADGVIGDFNKSFVISKNSSEPSPMPSKD